MIQILEKFAKIPTFGVRFAKIPTFLFDFVSSNIDVSEHKWSEIAIGTENQPRWVSFAKIPNFFI